MAESSLIDKCCLIGESVAGNPTHFMIEQAFESADLDWRFLTFEVRRADLAEAVRGLEVLGFRGVKFLPELRPLAIDFVTRLTDRAKRTKSVSSLIREETDLVGENLAGLAVSMAIEKTSPLAGKRAVLIGMGPTSLTLADALAEAQIGSLILLGDTLEKVEPLSEELKQLYPDLPTEVASWEDDPRFDDADVLISSAQWNRRNDQQIANAIQEQAKPKALVADLRISPSTNSIVRAALERDCKVVDGIEILAVETWLALRAWTGMPLNQTILREAAEEFMAV